MKNLIKLDGKAVAKLIDVVSKGIGTLYKPKALRNEADAEAYKIETLAKAESRKALIENDAQLEIVERTKARLVHQELNRQENIENIVEKAIPHLADEPSEEDVDADWRTRFFQKAQDVSHEDLQDMWARILASEISKPGQVSFRTLEIISNISRPEAELFAKACSLATACTKIWKLGGSAFDDYGINYSDLLRLREAGLIHDGDALVTNHSTVTLAGGVCCIVNLGERMYLFKNKTDSPITQASLQQVAFTNAGTELCKLISAEPQEKYYSDALLHFKKSYVVEDLVVGKSQKTV